MHATPFCVFCVQDVTIHSHSVWFVCADHDVLSCYQKWFVCVFECALFFFLSHNILSIWCINSLSLCNPSPFLLISQNVFELKTKTAQATTMMLSFVWPWLCATAANAVDVATVWAYKHTGPLCNCQLDRLLDDLKSKSIFVALISVFFFLLRLSFLWINIFIH